MGVSKLSRENSNKRAVSYNKLKSYTQTILLESGLFQTPNVSHEATSQFRFHISNTHSENRYIKTPWNRHGRVWYRRWEGSAETVPLDL